RGQREGQTGIRRIKNSHQLIGRYISSSADILVAAGRPNTSIIGTGYADIDRITRKPVFGSPRSRYRYTSLELDQRFLVVFLVDIEVVFEIVRQTHPGDLIKGVYRRSIV